jgi:hypothetical protein
LREARSVVNIEESLEILGEYAKLNFPKDIQDFVIIIFGDGTGYILDSISNLEFPPKSQICEFSDATNMMIQLKEMLQSSLNERREEVLNKIKKEMDQYGLTIQDLMKSDTLRTRQ